MKKLGASITTLLDSLYKFSLAAILIFIPLYPKFPLFTVPFSYVSIRAEDFLIAIVWLIFFARLFFVKKITLPKITFQFATFFLVTFLSSLSAILITKNIQPLIVILHFLRRVEYMSVFFLIYWASKDAPTRRYYLELVLLPSIGVFLYGLAQIFLGAPVISTMDSESSKGIALTLRPGVTLNSTFAGHYDLAVYLNMVMTYLVAISSSIHGWAKRVPFLGLFVALLWLFMQAGSRVGLVGLVLSVCLVSYFYRRYLLGFAFLLIIFSFIATSPQYIGRFETILKVFSAKMSQTVVPAVYAASKVITPDPTPNPIVTPEALRPIQQDTSTSIRFDVEWPRAIRAFYKNPFLGTGYSSISLATDNDYLRALGETGLIGLVAFLSILIAIITSLFSILKIPKISGSDRIIAVSSVGIFVAFLTTAIFIDVFESSKIAILFWAFMGLSLSINSKNA